MAYHMQGSIWRTRAVKNVMYTKIISIGRMLDVRNVDKIENHQE